MKSKPKTKVSSLLIKKKSPKRKIVKTNVEDTLLSEWDEQCKLIAFCDNHQDIRLRMIYSHINGVFISAKQGAKLALSGARAGIPDLCLPIASGAYHSLYIELKRVKPKGVVSAKQKEWLKLLNANGMRAVVCYGADEAIAVIKNYLNIK